MGLAKNSIITIISRTLLVILGIGSSIIIARILGPSGKGALALILLVPGLASNVGDLGLGVANVYYSGKEPERLNSLVIHSLLFACILGVFLFGVGLLIVYNSSVFVSIRHEVSPVYFIIAMSAIPFIIIIRYFDPIILGLNLILPINLKQLIISVLSLISIVLFLIVFRMGLLGGILSNIFIALTSAVYGYLLIKHLVGVKVRFSAIDWTFLKRSFSFGLRGYIANLTTFLHYRSDMFLIAFFLSTTQLGYYVIAVNFIEKVWLLPSSIANVLLPRLTSTTEDEAIKITPVVCRHTLVWTFLGLLLVLLVAKPLINLLYGTAFIPSVVPLLLLIPGIFTLGIGKVISSDLLSRGKPHYTMWSSISSLLINIVLNIILIPRWGIAGAAVASSISYPFATGLNFYLYHKESGVKLSTLFIPVRKDLTFYLRLWRR